MSGTRPSPRRSSTSTSFSPSTRPGSATRSGPTRCSSASANCDDAFEQALRRYAAATALASTASAQARAVYRQKAEQSLRTLTRWLSEHLMTAFEVTHQGRTKAVPEWLKGVNIREAFGFGPQQPRRAGSIPDHVNLVASIDARPALRVRGPGVPPLLAYRSRRSAGRRRPPTPSAWSAGTRPNKEATAVLDALELLDGDQLAPHGSRYARLGPRRDGGEGARAGAQPRRARSSASHRRGVRSATPVPA